MSYHSYSAIKLLSCLLIAVQFCSKFPTLLEQYPEEESCQLRSQQLFNYVTQKQQKEKHNLNKKAAQLQGNREMLQLFFSVYKSPCIHYWLDWIEQC